MCDGIEGPALNLVLLMFGILLRKKTKWAVDHLRIVNYIKL